MKRLHAVFILLAACMPPLCSGAALPDADAFAAAFYGAAAKNTAEGKNIVTSPASAFCALSVLGCGAAGETFSEILCALGFPPDAAADDIAAFTAGFHDAVKKAGDSGGAVFKISESVWNSPDVKIKADFKSDTLQMLECPAFETEMNASGAEKINSFVKAQTEGMIPRIIAPEDIYGAKLVLLNTLYMKAAWAAQFEKNATRKRIFHSPTGDIETDFMSRTGVFSVAHGSGFTAVALPYRNDSAEFIAVLPDAETGTAGLEQRLSGNFFDMDFTDKFISLSLPKMRLKWTGGISEVMRALGTKRAFSAEAEFSKMSDIPLEIGAAVQSVAVIVDENGTEAAAATVAIMRMMAAQPPDEKIVFNRPFLFFIRLKTSDGILFMGRFCNPETTGGSVK